MRIISRIILKSELDKAIRISRKYWKTGDVDILAARSNAVKSISIKLTGEEYSAGAVQDVIDAMISGFGLKQHATNQDIYDVFTLLGYEIKDDTEPDEEA